MRMRNAPGAINFRIDGCGCDRTGVCELYIIHIAGFVSCLLTEAWFDFHAFD